jgi:hypothetical protein
VADDFAIDGETASRDAEPYPPGVWWLAQTYSLPFLVLGVAVFTRVGAPILYATCQNSLLLAQARPQAPFFVYVVGNSGS